MAFRPLVAHGNVVACLAHALVEGEHGLDVVPGLIKRVLQEGAWRDRIVKVTGERATFATFEQFVNEHPPEGLGSSVRAIQNVCRDDVKACDLIDQATQGKPGRPANTSDNITDKNRRGTSRDGALRKLRKDAPDNSELEAACEVSYRRGFSHGVAVMVQAVAQGVRYADLCDYLGRVTEWRLRDRRGTFVMPPEP